MIGLRALQPLEGFGERISEGAAGNPEDSREGWCWKPRGDGSDEAARWHLVDPQ